MMKSALLTGPKSPVLRPFTSCIPRHLRVHASNDQNGTPTRPAIDSDMLKKLRDAEKEADRLRQELAEARAKAGPSADLASPEVKEVLVEAVRAGRIDGGDLRRLSPFAGGSDANWLAESDVTFISRDGPNSPRWESTGAVSDTEAEVVKRRLLIGVGLTLALGAFALVPTDALRINKPSKPLFLYIIPLLRIQALLADVREIVGEGKWEELEGALQRIRGTPNNSEANLRDAAYSLPEASTRQKAEALARDIIEYLDSIDYNKYYDDMRRPGTRGGTSEKQFSDFSVRAVDAAQAKLKEFLALMPRDALAAAREQASVPL